MQPDLMYSYIHREVNSDSESEVDLEEDDMIEETVGRAAKTDETARRRITRAMKREKKEEEIREAREARREKLLDNQDLRMVLPLSP